MKLINQGDISWCRRVAQGVCREMGLTEGRALDDLIGAGHVGLMIAARRFDSKRAALTGITFRQYAAMDVRRRCVAEAAKIIRCGVVGNNAPCATNVGGTTSAASNWAEMSDCTEKSKLCEFDSTAAAVFLEGRGSFRTSDLRR